MDKTQFILSIVTNIVAALIIWLGQRLVRGALSRFASGTIASKARQLFSANSIAILISVVIVFFDMWLLGKLVWRGGPFGRSELLLAMVISLFVAYWVTRVTSLRFRPELKKATVRLAELERREELRKDRRLSNEQGELLIQLLRGHPTAPYILRRGAGTNEIHQFSIDIGAVIERAGWRVQNGETMLVSGPRGVRLISFRPQNDHAAALRLHFALNEIGVTCGLEHQEPALDVVQHKDLVILYIGENPNAN